MHYKVIRYGIREIDDAIIEIQIAVRRAAAPSRLLILDKNPLDGELVVGIPLQYFLMHNRSSMLFVFAISSGIAPRELYSLPQHYFLTFFGFFFSFL